MTKKQFKNTVFSMSRHIYPLVARMLGPSYAEDAIQDIMMKLWVKRKDISKHPNIKGLVVLTARNHCIDVLRRKPTTEEYNASKLKIVQSKKDTNVEWTELNNIIKSILVRLPKQQKEVFEMRDLDGFETNEIAEALQIKKDHVRVLLSRARKQLAEALEKDYNYERGTY